MDFEKETAETWDQGWNKELKLYFLGKQFGVNTL